MGLTTGAGASLGEFKGERSLARAAAFRFWDARYSHPFAFFAAVAALCVIAAVAAASLAAAAHPQAAYAWGLDDLFNQASTWFDNTAKGFMDDFWGTIIQGEFEFGGKFLDSISMGQLTASFDQLFANSGAYQLVTSIHSTVINGIAYSVLAIVFLVQTVRIANKIDGNQAVPGVKEMIFLLIFFVIGKYIIDNSLLFCQAIYDVTTTLISSVDPEATYTHINMHSDLNDKVFTWTDDYGNEQSGKLWGAFNGVSGVIVGLVFILSSMVAAVVAYVVVFARAIQIYLYTILAPIPLSMLLCDETRQQAMGFIKNFLAICFAGFVIFLICKLYPMLMQSGIQSDNAFVFIVQSLAVSIVFIIGLVKSGGWARDVFGG